MAYHPIKPSEDENRGNDPRPLANEAREGAPMVTPIQPHYSPHSHRSNGLAGHDLEVTISAWWRAWTALKPWISGIAVLLLAALWHFLNSAWFNAPVPASRLAEVTSQQSVTNTELKFDIQALSKTAQSHDRILEKLANVTGEMRADVAFIKGAFSTLPSIQAYSPPPATIPTSTYLQPPSRSFPIPSKNPWRTSTD
jgi:hypothetical protein